ncbi:MAG: hypothetical protein GOV00_01490 [Candidatus Altiarchaeota archaeon]|nr:hypothetical protein [Candidatus Altiarchaeota archaeon]
MAQVKYWNGSAAIVQVFFAPGVLSPEAISEMLPRFETKVFETVESLSVNAFVRKIVKHHDYYALLAIEVNELQEALDFATHLEKRQRFLAKQIRNYLHQANKAI